MKWFTATFVLFIIAVILVVNAGLGPKVFGFMKHVPSEDLTGHFVLMGLLAFVVNLQLRSACISVGRLRLLKGSLIVLLLVTLEEFSQMFIPARTFSLLDLGLSYAGIFVLGRVALLVNRKDRTTGTSNKIRSV